MIVAVIGKIASGKSLVMKMLEKKGFACIYADKLVAELYKNNPKPLFSVRKYFGDEMFFKNGFLNKEKLRDLVFLNPLKLKILNKIIHPFVYKIVIEKLNKMRNKNVAVELTYLDEPKLIKKFDKILWIDRNIKFLEKTLVKERGFSTVLAKKAVGMIEKSPHAHAVIENNEDARSLNFLVSKALGL